MNRSVVWQTQHWKRSTYKLLFPLGPCVEMNWYYNIFIYKYKSNWTPVSNSNSKKINNKKTHIVIECILRSITLRWFEFDSSFSHNGRSLGSSNGVARVGIKEVCLLYILWLKYVYKETIPCCFLVITSRSTCFHFSFVGSTSGMVVAGQREKGLSMGEEENAAKAPEWVRNTPVLWFLLQGKKSHYFLMILKVEQNSLGILRAAKNHSPNLTQMITPPQNTFVLGLLDYGKKS